MLNSVAVLRNRDFTELAAIWFDAGLRVRATGVWFINHKVGIIFIKTEDKIKKNIRGRWN